MTVDVQTDRERLIQLADLYLEALGDEERGLCHAIVVFDHPGDIDGPAERCHSERRTA
ncbi:MAG: hypothetical protein JO130_19405 [Solirubrobacterales bacterium]|nr:hypothetical protein [Solirubrobacterales bacterium]